MNDEISLAIVVVSLIIAWVVSELFFRLRKKIRKSTISENKLDNIVKDIKINRSRKEIGFALLLAILDEVLASPNSRLFDQSSKQANDTVSSQIINVLDELILRYKDKESIAELSVDELAAILKVDRKIAVSFKRYLAQEIETQQEKNSLKPSSLKRKAIKHDF